MKSFKISKLNEHKEGFIVGDGVWRSEKDIDQLMVDIVEQTAYMY